MVTLNGYRAMDQSIWRTIMVASIRKGSSIGLVGTVAGTLSDTDARVSSSDMTEWRSRDSKGHATRDAAELAGGAV
jgi:hypothetical protein